MRDDEQLIFISYATPDRARVSPFHDRLIARGFNCWMDFRRLKAGQNWDFEIRRALKRAALVVMFVSKNSVDRRGYVQREVKVALDQALDRLIDDIYIIPVLLDDDAALPDQLRGIQAIKASDSDCQGEIEGSISQQLNQLGSQITSLGESADVTWSASKVKESWQGLPGYEVEYKIIRFSSQRYENISEISQIIEADLLLETMGQRSVLLNQGNDDHINFGHDKWRRTNTWDAFFDDPVIKGRIMTIRYTVSWFSAGAAHPNYGFKTFSFILDPLVRITSLESIFSKSNEALEALKSVSRTQLTKLRIRFNETDEPDQLEPEWVTSGTEDWSCFETFVFRAEGLEIWFPPYQVSAFVFGPQKVTIPYEKLANLMQPVYASALDFDFMVTD